MKLIKCWNLTTKLCPTMISAGRSTQKSTAVWRLLKCTDENFPMKLIRKPMRGSTVLDPTLTPKEELIRHVNIMGSLGYSDHKIVGDPPRREQGSMPRLQKSRLWSLKISTWKNPVQCIPREKRGPGEPVGFQVPFPLTPEWSISMFRKSSKSSRWLQRDPDKVQIQKLSV